MKLESKIWIGNWWFEIEFWIRNRNDTWSWLLRFYLQSHKKEELSYYYILAFQYCSIYPSLDSGSYPTEPSESVASEQGLLYYALESSMQSFNTSHYSSCHSWYSGRGGIFFFKKKLNSSFYNLIFQQSFLSEGFKIYSFLSLISFLTKKFQRRAHIKTLAPVKPFFFSELRIQIWN